MRKKIIFHIGLEKTGTTSFQRFCYENRRALAARGVLYPTRNLAFARQSRNHAALVAGYFERDGWADFDLARSGKAGAPSSTSLVAGDRARSGADRARQRRAFVLALLSVPDRAARRGFRSLRLPHRHRAARAMRSASIPPIPARSAPAAASRSTPSSTSCSLPENWYCRYAETIARWRRVFGDEAVAVLPFRKSRNVIDAAVDATCSASTARRRSAAIGYFVNADPGASVLEAMRRVNETLDVRRLFRGECLSAPSSARR